VRAEPRRLGCPLRNANSGGKIAYSQYSKLRITGSAFVNGAETLVRTDNGPGEQLLRVRDGCVVIDTFDDIGQ
jgi:hypothetical protein